MQSYPVLMLNNSCKGLLGDLLSTILRDFHWEPQTGNPKNVAGIS